MKKFLVLLAVFTLMACSTDVQPQLLEDDLEVNVSDMVYEKGCRESGGTVLDSGQCECSEGYSYGTSSGLCIKD